MYAFYILIFYMLNSLIAQDFWQEEKVHCVWTQCLLLTFWNHASSSSENSLTSSEEFHFCLKTTIIHPPTAQPKRFSINPETNTINNFNFISQQTSDDCSSRMKAGVLSKRCLSLTVYMRNSNSDAWLHKTSVIFHLVGHVEQWTLLERIKKPKLFSHSSQQYAHVGQSNLFIKQRNTVTFTAQNQLIYYTDAHMTPMNNPSSPWGCEDAHVLLRADPRPRPVWFSPLTKHC